MSVLELEKKIKFILEAYALEADKNKNNTQQDIGSINDANVLTGNDTQQLTDFGLQDSDITQATIQDTTTNIKDDINKLQLLTRLRNIIFFYTRLKNIIVSSTYLISNNINEKLLNDFYEIELLLEYLLVKFKTLDAKKINDVLNQVEIFINTKTTDLYKELKNAKRKK